MPDNDSAQGGRASDPKDPRAPGIEETAPCEPGSEPTARVGDSPPGGRLQPGEILSGRFIVRRFVAHGGMGEVYEAEDTGLRARVALKTLLPVLAEHAPSLERFRREVLLARSISHPNVCRVFELHSGTGPDGQPFHFLTMEFLPGESLSSLLKRRGRLSTAEALPLVRQMAAALDAAHEHGVVHRDFKPGNVVLVPTTSRGSSQPVRAVVTDFGIARTLSTTRSELGSTDGALTTDLLGTPDYMAPEQVSHGHEISAATDIFALGVVLYQMVTGKLPYPANSPLEAALRRLKDRPRPPQEIELGINSRWQRAILRCLEQEPARRPATAGDVVREIEEGVRPASSRRPSRPILAVAVVLVVIVAAALLLQRRWRPTAVPPQGARPVVAVLPLATQLPPSDAWLGSLLAQLLTSEVEEADGIRLLPWSRVLSAYRSLAIDTDQVLDAAKHQRLSELLPAQRFVEGTVRCPVEGSVDVCALAIEIRDGPAGLSVTTFEQRFARRDAGSAAGRAGEAIRRSLGVSITSAQAASLVLRQNRGAAVQRLYGEAVAAYARLDLATAEQLLESAASIDPGSFDVQRTLSQVLERRGLITRARQAAERAAAAASQLSARHQAESKARAEWLGTNEERAVAAYQALLQTRGDDVEIALALVRRLPARAGLEVIQRVRERSGSNSADLMLELQESLLARAENDQDRSAQLFDHVVAAAQRLKARRELAAAREAQGGGRLAQAEQLAKEVGDKQRAAYLHLALSQATPQEAPWNPMWRKFLGESLQAFRDLGDRVGVYRCLRERLAGEDDWQIADQLLGETRRELEAAGEPLSSGDHSDEAWIALGLGDLRRARQSLELARKAPRDLSSELWSDLPAYRTPFDLTPVELETLWQEDRLDEAEQVAKASLNRVRGGTSGAEAAFLCAVQCERGKLTEGDQCFDRLTLQRSSLDFWGSRLAECDWFAGDLDKAAKVAWTVRSQRIRAAASMADATALSDRQDGLAELTRELEKARRTHDMLERMSTDLILGSVEMRLALPSGRRRVEAVLAEARLRELPLLARRAAAVLATVGPSPGMRERPRR